MNTKNGARINIKKLVVVLTLFLFAVQCLPLIAFGATGKATIIKGGNTPTAPTNVQAAIRANDGSKYVTISWSPSKETEKGIAQYRIYRNGKVLGSTVKCSYTDRTVKEQEKYQYKVVAIGNNGRESRPGVSNTANLVSMQKVINAQTKETSYQEFPNKLTYKKVTSVQTGQVSYVLKPAAKSTSISSGLKLKSGLSSKSLNLKSLNIKKYNIKSKGVNLKTSASNNLSNISYKTNNTSASFKLSFANKKSNYKLPKLNSSVQY